MMKALKLYLSLIPLLLIGQLFFNQPCSACNCVFPSEPKEALQSADLVFSGKVVEIKSDVWENRQKGEIYDFRKVVRFEVDRIWKGESKSQIIVLTNYSTCGFEFKEGKSYFVYAYQDDRTGKPEWHVSTCSRTGELSSATKDLEVLGTGSEPSEKVNLSAEMNKAQLKMSVFHARGIYHKWVKPYTHYYAIAFIVIGLAWIILTRKKK